jgi:hypothetical protein
MSRKYQRKEQPAAQVSIPTFTPPEEAKPKSAITGSPATLRHPGISPYSSRHISRIALLNLAGRAYFYIILVQPSC